MFPRKVSVRFGVWPWWWCIRCFLVAVYMLRFTVPFPGLGNNLELEVPIHLDPGSACPPPPVGTAGSSALTYADVLPAGPPPPMLDLPPYWTSFVPKALTGPVIVNLVMGMMKTVDLQCNTFFFTEILLGLECLHDMFWSHHILSTSSLGRQKVVEVSNSGTCHCGSDHADTAPPLLDLPL
ncbi:hypothetical protein B0H16DRAFT_1483319 [Mycena metata]|uniref:Uncharacterized protein n=1 Tax=Mycena metata TaxID=1033252 RepID=A0AAD7DXB6_9AGAR|nr:hypothetical protein B0H16DRAFT_1483319 [Mycena metata]